MDDDVVWKAMACMPAVAEAAASLGRCERRSLGSWETKASAARRDRGIDQLRCDSHMQMVITANNHDHGDNDVNGKNDDIDPHPWMMMSFGK